MSLEVGKTVPDFSLIADNGKPFKLSNKVKKKALLVFYPGDGTPVCINQFADYKNNNEKFKDNDVEVIGVSTANTKSQVSFKKNNDLSFTFLSDEDGKVAKEYDCYDWFGTKRAVYLIDSNLELKYKSIESVSIFKKTADELIETIKKKS